MEEMLLSMLGGAVGGSITYSVWSLINYKKQNKECSEEPDDLLKRFNAETNKMMEEQIRSFNEHTDRVMQNRIPTVHSDLITGFMDRQNLSDEAIKRHNDRVAYTFDKIEQDVKAEHERHMKIMEKFR